MKKLLIIILIVCFSLPVYGEETIDIIEEGIVETSVKINGHFLYADTNHILVKDTTFVVSKYLVEALGGEIEWFGETQSVEITLNEDVIQLTIGSLDALVNGETFTLNKAPFIRNGRTMLPLRFVSEHLECEVSWVQETYTVEITKEDLEVPEAYIYDRPYTDEDLYYLSKIVTVESGEVSLEMAMAIANTVLNRVKDDRFPNTVKDVIFQVDKYVQFPPAHKASFESLQAKPISIMAAKKALEGVNTIGYSLYFNNQPFKSKSDDLIKVIDGEYFYE